MLKAGGAVAMLTLSGSLALSGVVALPVLGLGVYQSPPGGQTRQAVTWALEAGYRQIDTASLYGNEADVGAAVRASGLPREQVFVTTKLWNQDHGKRQALQAFGRSLAAL